MECMRTQVGLMIKKSNMVTHISWTKEIDNYILRQSRSMMNFIYLIGSLRLSYAISSALLHLMWQKHHLTPHSSAFLHLICTKPLVRPNSGAFLHFVRSLVVQIIFGKTIYIFQLRDLLNEQKLQQSMKYTQYILEDIEYLEKSMEGKPDKEWFHEIRQNSRTMQGLEEKREERNK